MPMLLKSEDGKEFELAVIEDRLPEAQDGFGDDEAVVVSFRVATEDQEWEETAPMLNVFELHTLMEWISAVAERGHEEPEIDLLEPELNFQVLREEGDGVRMRIRFTLEARPESFAVDAPTDEARHVDLKLSREALRIAAAQLREDLERLGDAGDGDGADDLLARQDLGLVRPPGTEMGLPADLGSDELEDDDEAEKGDSATPEADAEDRDRAD